MSPFVLSSVGEQATLTFSSLMRESMGEDWGPGWEVDVLFSWQLVMVVTMLLEVNYQGTLLSCFGLV